MHGGTGDLSRISVVSRCCRRTGALEKEAIYEQRVFFIRNLGFITHTEGRRISFEETMRFERIHEEVYRDFDFELIPIEAGSVRERVNVIKAAID